MAASHRLRALLVVKAQLITALPELGGRVTLGWRHWTQVNQDRFPCVYLDVAEDGGVLNQRAVRQGEGQFPFTLWGYTKPLGPFPDLDAASEARSITREALLKPVWELVHSTAMDAALLADNVAAAGGQGVTHLEVPTGPATDAGLIEGFGLFRLDIQGRVHIGLDSF